MADSQLFKYKVNSFKDVVAHLDALWYEHNELVAALSTAKQCGDPPLTCGTENLGKSKSRKQPARKAKK
jgi:hypothetical protein